MTWQMVYWITRFNAIISLCNWFFVFGLSAFLVGLCVALGFADCDKEIAKKILKRYVLSIALPIVLLSASAKAFLPSTAEACAIYLIPKIANNEQVQKIPENALRLLNAKFEEWIDEQIGEADDKQD